MKTQLKSKELEKIYQNAVFVCISQYNENYQFLVKNCVSRTQGLCHVIYTFFEFSIAEV